MATCTIEFPTVKLICSTKHVEHRCPIKFNENCNSGGDTRHDSHPACGWRKEFLRHFYVQKYFQSHRLSKTNWGGGGDFTVGFIKLNHATFPFQISLTKAFVVNVLSLFDFSLFGNNSGEFPGRFPQLVVGNENWSGVLMMTKKSWIPNRLDRHHRLCVLMVFSNFRIRETICHL